MAKKDRGARLLIGIVFFLIAAVILAVGLISDFAVVCGVLSAILVITGIQIARGKL